jgi:hypothetical protein
VHRRIFMLTHVPLPQRYGCLEKAAECASRPLECGFLHVLWVTHHTIQSGF